LNTLLAFLRYWREGLVDFRGGAAPAATLLLEVFTQSGSIPDVCLDSSPADRAMLPVPSGEGQTCAAGFVIGYGINLASGW
jgi:hypothetical protein